MLREHIFSGRTPTDPHFRWRGGDVSRIEALSDAAFAFALTLLLLQETIVRSRDLVAVMHNVLPLALCFTIVIWIWATHYKFFRRYGLEDNYTIVLNSALLFAVMIYVYPLKFLFDFVIDVVFFRRLPLDDAGNPFHPVTKDHAILMMQFYGAGYIVIFGIFALMVHHAHRQRDKLQLDEIEIHLTRYSFKSHVLTAGVGVLSIVLTIVIPRSVLDPGIIAGIAGIAYGLNGPIQWIAGTRMSKKLTELEARLVPESTAPDDTT